MLTARFVSILLALTTAQAAIILNSQFRSANDDGTIQTSVDPGQFNVLGDCNDNGVMAQNISDVSTSGFTGTMQALICFPVAPRFAEGTYAAQFTLTEAEQFKIVAFAATGDFGGQANFSVARDDGTWIVGVAAGVPPFEWDSMDAVFLLDAGNYTVSSNVAGESRAGDDGQVFASGGHVGFSIIPTALIPEPATLLLIAVGLAGVSLSGGKSARSARR